MMDGETIRFIRQEISRQVNIILSGRSANATIQTEDIEEMFPGMPTITKRPVMHPFGLCSVAPDGIISVVARQGEHIGNRLVLGHRDKNKPACQKGEAVLYNQFGQQVYLKDGEMVTTAKKVTVNADGDIVVTSTGDMTSEAQAIKITADTITEVSDAIKMGSAAAAENFVLGQVFKVFANNLLTAIQAITVTCSTPGNSSSTPVNSAAFAAFAASPIGNDLILSDKIMGEK